MSFTFSIAFTIKLLIRIFLDKSQPPPPAINRVASKHAITGITSVGAVSHVSNIKHLEEGNTKNAKTKIIKNKKKDKKPKIRKEDIGSPINFQ